MFLFFVSFFFFLLTPEIGSLSEIQSIAIGHLSSLFLEHSFTLNRKWQSTPVLLPGKSHGQRSLVGYSPWGRKELDTTERLHFHSQDFSSSILVPVASWVLLLCYGLV